MFLNVEGVWFAGRHASQRGTVSEVRVRTLCTRTDDGRMLMGDPDDFRSDDGLSGAALLTSVFTRVTVAGLHRGAVRQALAADNQQGEYGALFEAPPTS